MNDYNNVLVGFSELIKNEEFRPYEGDLRLGVDLGTANIVVSVVDSNNTPIAGASYPSTVVRDGIVVDFMGASRAVRNMKAKLEGAVVDVGGGTTGISILKDGEVIFTADEPTGGTHMTLVLAGSLGCSFEEAERIKKDPKQEMLVFPVVKPVIEKMAAIVARFIEGYDVDVIYVVGGACSFKKFESVFEKETGVKTIKPKEPLLVTPLGIAMNCNKQ